MFEIKEKPQIVESALLVGIQRPEMAAHEGDSLLTELKELVETLGISVEGAHLITLRRPTPHYLIGSGKAEELIQIVKQERIELIVFDDELSPAQQRNWEKESGVAVIDRQEVILDIFARRAQTREAMLQVGLARMNYSLPRLKRAWTHLSRQRGGGGTVVRGSGETQLETDHRLVQDRIARLKKELSQVIRQRETQRKKRLKKPVPTAAIVGYTNAGKSSLLNRITGSNVLAENKLFATLDPTTRQSLLPSGQTILLTDTVGFVRRLPHNLIDAFRATLEESIVSDFLIHVLDMTNPEVEKHQATTIEVLTSLGANKKKIITVFNKVDICENPFLINSLRMMHPKAHFVSSRTGEGLDGLLTECEEMITDNNVRINLLIPHDRYDLIGKLHDVGCVNQQSTEDGGVRISGIIPLPFQEIFQPFSIEPAAALKA